MILFLIIISIILFACLSNLFFNKKIFIIISIIAVVFCYFLLVKSFFYSESFLPSSKNKIYFLCGNYYNLVAEAIKHKRLYITTSQFYPKLETDNPYEKYLTVFLEDNKYHRLLDTSYYKGKIYLYFGITPVLLFYLPFNLITGLYLTDQFLVFILASFIFVISLLFCRKLIKEISFLDNSPPFSIFILTVFLIAFCNYTPFLLIRNKIYEAAIMTASLFLILSFLFLYFYMETQNIKKQYILICLCSFCLALSVGARAYYVLHIPLFFGLVVFIRYKQTKNIKNIIKTAIAFLIPCLVYGTIVALYNYLRFDSIFEFGWKYQLNDLRQYEYSASIKDSLLALKYNLFQCPQSDENTIFSLAQATGHRIGNEFVAGIIWTFPLILSFFLLPKFLSDTFNKNKNIFYMTILMIAVISINLIVTSFIGMINRYFYEYMIFAVILSIVLFYYLYNEVKTKSLKNFLNIFFMIIFAYCVFMSVCLLFCENNALYYAPVSAGNYEKTIGFLFK